MVDNLFNCFYLYLSLAFTDMYDINIDSYTINAF